MTSKYSASIMIQWGGEIIENDTEVGLNYIGGQVQCVRLKQRTTYDQLVEVISRVVGIDKSNCKLKMIFRCPTYIGLGMKYFSIVLCDNDSVDTMLHTVIGNPSLPIISVYVVLEPLSPIQNQHFDLNNDYQQYGHQQYTLTPPQLDSDYQQTNYGTYNDPLPPNHFFQNTPTNHYFGDSSKKNHYFGSSSQPTIHHSPVTDTRNLFEDNTEEWESEEEDPNRIEDLQSEDEDFNHRNDEEYLDNNVTHEHFENNAEGATNVFNSNRPMHTPMTSFFTNSDGFDIPFQGIGPTYVEYAGRWDPMVDEPRKGLIFKDKASLKHKIRAWAVKNEREMVGTTNNNSKCWEVKCKLAAQTGCDWKLRASKQVKHNMFEIVTYKGPHICTHTDVHQDHNQLSASLIHRELVEDLREDPSKKIKVIQFDIQKKFGFRPSYRKAWQGKQKALAQVFGDWEASYNYLPTLLGGISKYNHGTIVDVQTVPNNSNPNEVFFIRAFWAFRPCIEGFKNCRPVVCIDATHLYGKYKGKLLIAMGKDGNNQVFPLAFAIVDEESSQNWGWFLRNLRRNVVGVERELCLISDRHRRMLSAVNDPSNGWTEPLGHHRFCLFHVRANLFGKYKNKDVYNLCWLAGTTHQIRKFHVIMESIKEISAGAYAYLEGIPYVKWTLAYDGGYRFGETTTNHSECFNGVLKGARNLPLSGLVQFIFYKIIEYFEKRRDNGIQAQTEGMIHCPVIYAKCERAKRRGAMHRYNQFNRELQIGEVITMRENKHAVHLLERYCSCGKWTIYHIPCSHAFRVMKHVGLDYYSYVSEWYTVNRYVQTWATNFHPLEHEDYWPVRIGPTIIPNPQLARGIGRPKSTRIENAMDMSKRTRNRHN